MRTDSNRFAITPIERTSPPCFGYGYGNRLGMNIETTNSTLDMSDYFFSYAALRRWIHLFAA
ncbi:MAG: hypothetical protein KGM92_20260 [Acidobacteriota bacterium]|nr:hypothetical protein [Acidobacteriota bacterium]